LEIPEELGVPPVSVMQWRTRKQMSRGKEIGVEESTNVVVVLFMSKEFVASFVKGRSISSKLFLSSRALSSNLRLRI
jgi:hypothetical protein